MTPGSELLQTMADKLNREILGVEDWRHPACKLDVPVDKRKAFGGLGPKGKSPTREVMQWLVAQFPDTILKDVVKALHKIQRNEAIQIITRQIPDTVGKNKHCLVVILYLLFSKLRRGSTPVSTFSRKSVRFFRVTQKPQKRDSRDKKNTEHFLREHGSRPL